MDGHLGLLTSKIRKKIKRSRLFDHMAKGEINSPIPSTGYEYSTRSTSANSRHRGTQINIC